MDKNKLFAGLLAAGVVTLGSLVIGEGIFKPDHLEKSAFIPEGVVATADAGAGAAVAPTYAKGEDFAKLVASADVSAGEGLIKKCVACHAFEQGGANKVGPALWGVFNSVPTPRVTPIRTH
jgi:cytochrome c